MIRSHYRAIRRPLPTRARTTLPRTRTRARAGYSLVEVMVAIVLLAITVSSLAGWMLAASGNRRKQDYRAVARIAGQERLDSVRTRPFSSLMDGTTTTTATVGRLPLKITTAIEPSSATLKIVRVTVRTENGGFLQEFVTAVYGGA